MKIIYKIIVAFLLICSLNTCIVFAAGTGEDGTSDDETKMEWKDGFRYAENFIDGKAQWDEESSDNPDRSQIEETIRTSVTNIFKFLIAIGTVLSVIIGAVLGVSFMMASAEDKAKVKEAMLPYITGCIVIFGAGTIWYTVVTILEKVN